MNRVVGESKMSAFGTDDIFFCIYFISGYFDFVIVIEAKRFFVSVSIPILPVLLVYLVGLVGLLYLEI